jgi:hypothetical protein
MRCEEVRPLLPDLADGTLRAAGEAEAHVAACSSCSFALAVYRDLLARLAAMREVVVEPSDALLERLVAATARRGLVRRVAGDERVQHAALSIGGAVVGATAIGLLWWRAARRALAPAPDPASGVQRVGP